MLLALRQKILSKYGSLGVFCQIVQVKQPRLSEVIHGKRKLNPAKQERWAKILGANKEKLFKGINQ